MASIDDDLAQAASQSLTLGSSIVTDLQSSPCVLPRNLHFALYSNSMCDVPMNQTHNSNHNSGGSSKMGEIETEGENSWGCRAGVPGFPDFPDIWMGGTSSASSGDGERKTRNQTKKGKMDKAQSKRQQRRLRREAVNKNGMSKPAGTIKKEVKKKKRDERRMRRVAVKAKQQERRSRKKGMGDICRGMASIACK